MCVFNIGISAILQDLFALFSVFLAYVKGS